MKGEVTNIIFAFFSLQVGLICSLIAFGDLRRKINVALEKSIQAVKIFRESKALSHFLINSFAPTFVLLGLFASYSLFPGHDFALFDAPTLHALVSSIRDIFIFIFGVWAFPLVAVWLATLVIYYLFNIVKIAAASTGGDYLALAGIVVSVISTWIAIDSLESKWISLFLCIQLAIITVVAWRPISNSIFGVVNKIKENNVYVLLFLFVKGIVAIALGVISLVVIGVIALYAYLSIFIFDKAAVHWEAALMCQVQFPNILTIEDILVGVNSNQESIFTRQNLVRMPANFELGSTSLFIAAKVNGIATHARIRAVLMAELEKNRVELAQVNEGGFYLENGYFYTSLRTKIPSDVNLEEFKKATLWISIAPQGNKNVHFNGKPWSFFAKKEFNLTSKAEEDGTQIYLSEVSEKIIISPCVFTPLKQDDKTLEPNKAIHGTSP